MQPLLYCCVCHLLFYVTKEHKMKTFFECTNSRLLHLKCLCRFRNARNPHGYFEDCLCLEYLYVCVCVCDPLYVCVCVTQRYTKFVSRKEE